MPTSLLDDGARALTLVVISNNSPRCNTVSTHTLRTRSSSGRGRRGGVGKRVEGVDKEVLWV